jgi:hypothetical protein
VSGDQEVIADAGDAGVGHGFSILKAIEVTAAGLEARRLRIAAKG